jgi:hypothetical protein
MTEIFGLDHFGLGLGYFGSVFGLRLTMPRVSHRCHCSKIICSGRHSIHFGCKRWVTELLKDILALRLVRLYPKICRFLLSHCLTSSFGAKVRCCWRQSGRGWHQRNPLPDANLSNEPSLSTHFTLSFFNL